MHEQCFRNNVPGVLLGTTKFEKYRTIIYHSLSCSAATWAFFSSSFFFFFFFSLLLFVFFFRASLFTLNCSSFLSFFRSAVSFARRACGRN